jgi:hypothetical protein
VSLDNVLLQLKNIYGQESEVIFSKKSTARSQVTCNLILCGAGSQRIKFRHRFEEGQWKFEDFANNNEQLVKFENWYKDYLEYRYGANKDDIIVHKVTKGSIFAWASVSPNNFLIKNSEFTSRKDINVIPFFQAFDLSPDDFDAAGNHTFPENARTGLQWRGGIPYFQPVYGTRFGFKISKKYDAGDDAWLSMNGVAG